MKYLMTLAFVLAANAGRAQLSETGRIQAALNTENRDTVAWLHTGVVQAGINQGFLHNWAAGGEIASLAVDALLSANITRLCHRQVWSNSIDASYSLFYAYSNNFVPRKVDDRLDMTSKYGVRLDTAKNFYLTSLLNFKSQFTRGYDYSLPNWQSFSTSNFLSPAYITLAEGIEYRRGAALSLFLSPLAGRLTLADRKYTIRDPQGAFGIAYGKESRGELGAYFSGRYVCDFSKTVHFKTRLDLYSNYLAKDRKDSTGAVMKRDNPGNVAIFWDNLITIKLGKYINLNLSLTAVYDNDLPYNNEYTDATTGLIVTKNDPGTGLGWWQIKEVMAFGVAYQPH